MLYYSSTSGGDGSTTITVTFDVSRNQDLAAVDVQNAVKLAEPQLPAAVRNNGITIIKANTDILGIVFLGSSDSRYDATYLSNFMKLYVVDELKRVPGIGDATPFPNLDFSMLLQLDPSKMAQLGVTVGDVSAAVQEQNATNPAGRLGREPSPPGTQLTYAIPFDTTPFVTASIKEVLVTLAEAMLLVTLVVFLFLQSWRATLIPMLAVPVSVIGTFLGLYVLGMSINVLTLFGLVLAIGIVVDDATVVIENVERIMAAEKISARLAADRA